MDTKKENYLKVFLGLFSMTMLIYIGSTLFKRARLDLTEEKIYTLSDGTKSILKKLDSPIRLKFYYSKTAANKGTEGLRQFNNYSLYVQDLLRQYVANSRNNLSLQVIDPRPDTPEEEDALAYGLKKFHLTETEKYFFGLAAENESGTEKIIEFFDPGQKDKLEYQLTKLIYQVLNPAKKIIGVLSSIDVIAEDVSPMMAQIMRMQGKNVETSWGAINALKELYRVQKIDPQDTETIGVDTLVIIHPKGFSEKTLFAVDQFVMNGGNVLILADPLATIAPSDEQQRTPSSSPDAAFQKLMDKWGLKLKTGVYAGDRYLAGYGRTRPDMPATKLLTVLNCDKRCSEKHKDNISSGLSKNSFILPGVVESQETEGVTFQTVLSTSDKGNEYRVSPYMLNNAQATWSQFSEGTGVNIAMRAMGKFKTAYPNGPTFKKEEEKSKKTKKAKKKKEDADKKDYLTESKKESAVVLIADVDFLNDNFSLRQSFLGSQSINDNIALFLNAIEALSGNVDLLSVRAKGRIDRGFDVIRDIELEAEKKTEDKVKEINASILKFQQELNEIGRQKGNQNVAILQNESLRKKKELGKKIALLKKELREVKREGRERIESIGKMFQYLNTLAIPFLIIIFGFYFYGNRSKSMQGRRLVKKDSNEVEATLKEVEV